MGLAQALPNPRTQPVPEAMVRAWLLMLLTQRSVGLESNASDADAECLLQSRRVELVADSGPPFSHLPTFQGHLRRRRRALRPGTFEFVARAEEFRAGFQSHLTKL